MWTTTTTFGKIPFTYVIKKEEKLNATRRRILKEEIVELSSKLSIEHGVSNAEYVDDFTATSRKPKWKISAR